MKTFLLILFALVLLPFMTEPAQAGGSNVILVAKNGGMAQRKGVDIIVTVFEPAKNKLDWNGLNKYALNTSGYEPIGVKDLELELEFENPLKNQHCNMGEGGWTNEYGQVRATCYSDAAGEFTIKTKFKSDKSLYEGGPAAKGACFTLAITFYEPSKFPDKLPVVTQPKASSSPTKVQVSPSPKVTEAVTNNKLAEIEKENQVQKAQIEELKKTVAEQKQEVSRLSYIIQRIQAFFGSLFK